MHALLTDSGGLDLESKTDISNGSSSQLEMETESTSTYVEEKGFEVVPRDLGLPFTKYVDIANLSENNVDVTNQEEAESTVMLYLKNNNAKNLKSFLRLNSLDCRHPSRAQLWVNVCEYLHKAKGHVYEEFEHQLFGQRESHEIPLPSFVDFDNLTSYHLNRMGVRCINKILAVIQYTNPDIIYAPTLFSMLSIFLHYMEPSDVYNCIYQLLRAKEPFIMQTKVAVEASKFVLKDLAKKYTKPAYVNVVKNCNNMDAVFESWTLWLFSDLPFSYIIRIMDCYLVEGVKVLYRTVLAILLLYTKYSAKQLATTPANKRDIPEGIRKFCSEMPYTVEKLFKKSFGIRGLNRKEITKLHIKHEMIINSRTILQHELQRSTTTTSFGLHPSKSFSGPLSLKSDSSILKQDWLYTVWSWIPPRCAVCQPELLYTSEEHGTSLMTLYTRVEDHQPTLILIKTTTDEVFGAFCSTYWRDRRRSTKNVSYFGTGETFIFTLSPEKKKYEWVGLHQDDVPNTANMFQAGDNSILTIGGGNGEAIQLDANLLHCRTEKCDTFDNDPLCSEEDFTCKVVEVYGFQ